MRSALLVQVAFRRFREAKKRRLLRALRMKREAEREVVEFAPLKPSLFEFGSAMLTGSPGAHPLPHADPWSGTHRGQLASRCRLR